MRCGPRPRPRLIYQSMTLFGLFMVFKGPSHLQTHLTFVFGCKRPFIYKVVSDSSYGRKPNGRRRLLSQEEEIAIVELVKVSHKRGQCDNIAEVTA
jgi:hypothetical protein